MQNMKIVCEARDLSRVLQMLAADREPRPCVWCGRWPGAVWVRDLDGRSFCSSRHHDLYHAPKVST